MENLKDKVVYITGGTHGIGFGVAKVLLSKGMRVAISGRRQEDAEEAAKKITSDENRVLGVASDVTDFENEKTAIAKIVEKFGQLDVVLANAGVGHFAPIYELKNEDWKQMIDTNLTGAFHTLKASFEALKKSEGYYITLASLAGTNFFENGAGYNASKFGVVGFTQAAMLDLRSHNIKVSTIMPGSVASQFNNHVPSSSDDWKIQPEDIGELVYDLLKMHPRTLPSKIEVRPTRPDKK
ncbi:SDR family oxidoreductase [Candidatus Ornithobacterium hominis]|uniref:SDR family oxidoreductase n=1 Tax=Candidatus Ornithobacterium hominis TaxID=2497989 RepID=UPI0024BC732E|nr:SDR family oxidoreductase [Candidatus Ornithobacterium hominis]CAI9430141.1 SDR family oxidoreductase [Candidatus Ornithobacterium hominis]